MSIYIKVNGTEYPAEVTGRMKDSGWDDRQTKTIHLDLSYSETKALLPSGTPWSIVQRDTVPKYDEDGQPTGETEEHVQEWDNSDYCLAGDITGHRDGTASIKMGKATEAETLRAQLADAETAAKILLMEEK